MLSPLKNIFWLVLHTASALAATIILNLHIADALTENTTSILKHLQTAAAVYCQEKAAEAIRTYGYQPTSLWESTVQDAIDATVQLTQQPHLILLTIVLAVIAAVIRYCFMLHQLKKQRRHQRQSCTLTAGRMLKLYWQSWQPSSPALALAAHCKNPIHAFSMPAAGSTGSMKPCYC